MVYVYIPYDKLVMSSVVSLLLQRKLYGPVPPLMDKSILPSLPPLQLMSFEIDDIFGGNGSESVIERIALQLLESVTVTE